MIAKMIKDFLIINCIGKDDKLGLRINKDFFTKKIENKTNNETLVYEILKFLENYSVILNESFSVLVNQGPGSFSRLRKSIAVAKGLHISKKVKLYGFKSSNLTLFSQENVEKILKNNLIEKKLIKPIYLS